MDVFYTYTYASAGWLTLQSLALLTLPELITTTLLDDPRHPSDIEIYFARSLGLALLAFALLTTMLTGSIPLTSSSSSAEPPRTDNNNNNNNNNQDTQAPPYAGPTLVATTGFHAVRAFHAYTRYVSTGMGVLAIGVAGDAAVAALGLWCVLFAGSEGKISRRTGRDKHTAGFPFKNVNHKAQ